jgi:hypothetical protein
LFGNVAKVMLVDQSSSAFGAQRSRSPPNRLSQNSYHVQLQVSKAATHSTADIFGVSDRHINAGEVNVAYRNLATLCGAPTLKGRWSLDAE